MGSTAPQQLQSHVPMGPDWIQQDGVLYHTPHYFATREAASKQAKVNPDILLNYGNGPVLVAPKAYIIFWGYKTYGDADKVAKLLKSYAKNMGGSGHNNIYTQYYEIVSSTTTYITNPKKQLGGVWMDNTNAVPAHPSDAQVAAEALNGVAKFGYDPNGSYVVATPHGHSSTGFGTQWCAYHSATFSSGKLVSYTNLPYMPDAGSSCGANFTTPPSDESATDEGVTIVEGHEYGESVTDPNPPSGWYNGSEGEIGDICAWQDIQNDPFGKKSYTSQPMFSNATQSCVQSYP
ncbi:MAG TPA: hypothetical protein VMU38_06320 [Candidatus Binatia bacterium]|nr:hypothetical protein [Candidatus Binatia bacterium]